MSDESSAAPAANEQTSVAQVPAGNQPAEQPNPAAGPLVEATSGEPAAETTGEAGDGGDKPKSPNKVPYQERISQLVQQRRSAEQDRDHFHARTLELEKQLNARANESTDLPNEPQEHEYGSDQEFRAAQHRYQQAMQRTLARNVADTIRKETLAEQAEQAEIRAQSAREAAWQEGLEGKREKMPDFEAVAYSQSVPYNTAMLVAVKDSPHGHEVAYWLGKNIAEAARIEALPPIQAAVEIGRLEARLSATAAPRFTQAPPPVKTVTSGFGAASKTPSEMSFAEYEVWRKASQG